MPDIDQLLISCQFSTNGGWEQLRWFVDMIFGNKEPTSLPVQVRANNTYSVCKSFFENFVGERKWYPGILSVIVMSSSLSHLYDLLCILRWIQQVFTSVIVLVKTWFHRHQAYTIPSLTKKKTRQKEACFLYRSTGCYNIYNIFSNLTCFSSKVTPGIAVNADSFNSFTWTFGQCDLIDQGIDQ